MICKYSIAGTYLATGLLLPVFPQANGQLPSGPGKETVQKLCVGCHQVDVVIARRHTQADWEGVIGDMIARGSKGTEEELSVVADYLSKYFGRVNVNTATAQELETGLKIPEREAKAIVSWREQHGKFTKFEEVRKVPGLDAKFIEKRGWITFE